MILNPFRVLNLDPLSTPGCRPGLMKLNPCRGSNQLVFTNRLVSNITSLKLTLIPARGGKGPPPGGVPRIAGSDLGDGTPGRPDPEPVFLTGEGMRPKHKRNLIESHDKNRFQKGGGGHTAGIDAGLAFGDVAFSFAEVFDPGRVKGLAVGCLEGHGLEGK